MLAVRPVRPGDLPALERLAGSAQPRLTNLPAHRDRLEERIARSQRAFASEAEVPGDEHPDLRVGGEHGAHALRSRQS